jgi:TolB-like protein/class 3 adenylate cyclase
MPKRQLAAIMFTDIEGYTALMQENEERAIQVREKHRAIFNSITEKHTGRILQYYGDGTLSIFDSAIDAVNCGIEMQLGFQEDPAIPVRIGIHTGDIIFSEDEIIGDGVNVAARIESLAVPGSVFISEKVYDEIKNQESIKTSVLKTFKLKNIAKPVGVYAIANVGMVVPKPEDIEGKTEVDLKSAEEKPEQQKSKNHRGVTIAIITATIVAALTIAYLKFGTDINSTISTTGESIAVLAFENMSGEVDQEYFSDGISEEILNALTKVEGLKVAGRTSAFSFKGKNEDIRTIGEKLDVKMVLEGSVRKDGSKVRITAQLISVEDGFHLWSETYDREMEDIFAIQDEIAAMIVEKLKLQVHQQAKGITRTKNIAAYDLLLKGIYFLNKDYEGTIKGMEYFQKAVELDPEYASAYAWIGDAYTNYAAYGFMSSAEAYNNARTAAQKSINLNEQEPRAHKVMAYVHLYYDWDWQAALSEYQKAIQYGLRDPDHFITYYDIFVNKDYEHAIAVSEQILEIDPIQIEGHWHLGFCNLLAGRFEEALGSFDNALELDSNYSEGHRWKGQALAYMGRFEEAVHSVEKALEITKGQGPANFDLLTVKALMGKKDEVLQTLEAWEKSGVPIDPIGPAILYAMLAMPDSAIVFLEKSYRERSLWMASLKFYWVWDPYREDPRFIEIYNKMNFPE